MVFYGIQVETLQVHSAIAVITVEPAVQRFSCESEAFGYRFEEKVFMYQVF